MSPDHAPDQSRVGFDELLRSQRLAAGLTQAELAARAGVGIRTVRDLERARSSRPQRTTVDLLATALGLAGPDRTEFQAVARGQTLNPRPVIPRQARATLEPVTAGAGPATDADAVTDDGPAGEEDSMVLTGPGRSRGLPPPGDLVGRDCDVAELAAALTGPDAPPTQLISLVGLAGVGKTSLALAVAAQVGAAHHGGIGGIVITEGSTVSDILTATATVFGVGRTNDLAARLTGAPALLLVDAVERAPAATADALHWLTASAAALRVVATGRHPVGLPDERVWPVAPLEVPPADTETDLAAVAGYPAVRLFLARLRQVRREPIHQTEVGALVGLVRRLGGLPLAIELAAARGRALDLNEIFNRYGDRLLDLSGPPPTRATVAVTLRDAVTASYRLLNPGERYAIRRLSVFRNRWSVELAEGMLAVEPADSSVDPIDPVPYLDRLMALGLLGARGVGPYRFRLIDVVRDLATERAAARGELAAIRRRHAALFAALAERSAVDLAGPKLVATVNRLDEVASDLWAALAHSANDDPHTALRLAASLPRWWRFRGRDVAGRRWLRRLLDDPRTADADPTTRAWAQVGVAALAVEHSAGPQELPTLRAALATFTEAGDTAGALAARGLLSVVCMAAGGFDEARQHAHTVLALAGRTGRVRDMTIAQQNLAWHEIRVGDLRAARRRLAAVDRLAARAGEDRLRVLARANLAEVARLEGRHARAVDLGRQVLSALTSVGDPSHRRRVIGTIGLALAQDGRLGPAEEALTELRAQLTPAAAADSGPMDLTGVADQNGAEEDPRCAMIEATIAAARGDRELAVEWFAVAARSVARNLDSRDGVEALVGLVVNTETSVARMVALDRLAAACRDNGVQLLPDERKAVGWVDGTP
ncbi:helix-turn-helix domain-containing protein [Solwaraspora sp. WMMD406]|uniref:ATP-binding protein n=1 Tax=Solwaraspora sp. WMMD406 TaxID=3016095 RepID=UPI002416161C|nr:helix-turn-helix domain-containing protein [Solwaraspora sp. WMMD406]MDG4762992.1 helix-turn-helix domain-containing protein [Solwaraspora sp. WMMD406]